MHEPGTQRTLGTTDFLLMLMALIWGINFSVIKYATEVMSPLAFTGLRVMIAASVLGAIALVQAHRWPSPREIGTLLALGMIGNGIYQLLFVQGLARTRAGNAALIVAAAPAFIAVASHLRGIERLSPRTVAGVVLSVAGVALVVLGSARPQDGDQTLLGTLLVFCGLLCWTLFTVLLQPYAMRLNHIHLSALTMAGGSIPMIFAVPALVRTEWHLLGTAGWSAILYASVGSMVLAYLFWYRGLRVLGPTRTAVYGNLQPMIAILVAWLFLSETPTIWQGVGTGTIMTGIFLSRS